MKTYNFLKIQFGSALDVEKPCQKKLEFVFPQGSFNQQQNYTF